MTGAVQTTRPRPV